MAYAITSEDMRLITQPEVQCFVKIDVLNDNETIISSIEGAISGGTNNIDSKSDIRRTCSFVIVPTLNQDIKINEASLIWLNKAIKLQVGIKDIRTKEVTYWNQGYFLYTETSGQYDASNNMLTVNCADFMVLFDGSRNGVLGYYQVLIQAYREDSNTGEVLEYHYIRDAIKTTVQQLGRINQMQIDDVGEYKGLESRNPDGYIQYRAANKTWNCVPYDLTFSAGDNVLTILTTLRDLYPNYEMFFDENNVFVCKMKPSGYDDMVMLTNEQIQSILLAENTENTSLSFSEVKNISEVWGELIETDFYTEGGVTYVNNVYIVPNEAYVRTSDVRYYNGDVIAFHVPTTNQASPKLNVQNLGAIDIYDGENLNPLKAGILIAGRTYTFKIKRSYENGTFRNWAIYMGQYQPHAMTVLLSKDHHDEMITVPSGQTVELYSPEYFFELYDVSAHALTRVINPDSPYTIEKIGSILQVETKQVCTTDDLALAQSNYNNYVATRLTDSVTISTLLIPFLDVGIKVEYKPYNSDTVNQYLVDTIAHDYNTGKSTITMHRFYPLYEWI